LFLRFTQRKWSSRVSWLEVFETWQTDEPFWIPRDLLQHSAIQRIQDLFSNLIQLLPHAVYRFLLQHRHRQKLNILQSH
jgi:hypothetical protein